MSKERRLGRGLEALLGRSLNEPAKSNHLSLHVPQPEGDAGGDGKPTAISHATAAPAEGPMKLNIKDIQPNPFQPRREFDAAELASLADSLKEHGLLQPLLVRRVDDRYQLIAGERRLRAAAQAGWTEVPVIVREADDRQLAELAIVENLQRKDLNALEKAASFEHYLKQYGCTQEELAKRLSIDRSTIANLIRLLELPAAVQKAIRDGVVTQGHARALLPLGDEEQQVAFCQRIQVEGLSVRATEQIVQDMIQAHDGTNESPGAATTSAPTRKGRSRSQNVAALEQELRQALGTKVAIKETARGRGKIVILFASSEEFERLRDYLIGPEKLARAG